MNALLEMTENKVMPIQHAVLFMDLDRFKQVNDLLGHAIGDQLLVEVSKRVKTLVRNKDIIARFGGDEFVITLANIQHPREAAKFAEHVLRVFEAPIKVHDRCLYIDEYGDQYLSCGWYDNRTAIESCRSCYVIFEREWT